MNKIILIRLLWTLRPFFFKGYTDDIVDNENNGNDVDEDEEANDDANLHLKLHPDAQLKFEDEQDKDDLSSVRQSDGSEKCLIPISILTDSLLTNGECSRRKTWISR